MKRRFCPHPARAECSGGVRANHTLNQQRLKHIFDSAQPSSPMRSRWLTVPFAERLLGTRRCANAEKAGDTLSEVVGDSLPTAQYANDTSSKYELL